MGINVEPIKTKKVYRVIIEQILQMICSGELEVGQRLPPERELAEMFQVSRPSVREAMRVMEVMGLLDRRPGGGSVVTDLNIGELLNMLSPVFLKRGGFAIELVELRYLLETRAAELAAEQITPDKAESLRSCIARMAGAGREGDSEAEARADIEFHETIFAISDNYVLQQAARFVTSLLENSVRFGRRVILEGGYENQKLLEQHRRILDGIAAGKPAEARAAMETHMKLVFEYYLRADRGAPGETV